MEKNDLASLLRDFAQATSNSVASNAAVPVDVLAWLLRKGGVNVPPNPVMGSDWLAEKGFTREVKNKGAGLAGDIAGMVLPFAGVTKAPQIAKGLLGMGENLATPNAMKNASQRGAIVWHGSPHKFDAFDSSKIGTGEGAQAYGHGLYLAENPSVAKGYRDKLSGAGYFADDGKYFMKNDSKGTFHSFDPKTNADALINEAEFYKDAPASLYKVDLPDEHIAKMLDYDLPISQQAPDVQAALTPVIEKFYGKGNSPYVFNDPASPIKTGKDLMISLGYDKQASNNLRMAGIPGIKYLDGGSRGAGQGSQNFVVFPGNERLLKILERNGESVAPKVKFDYPIGDRDILAQQRAALPKEQGGLGLRADNTAMERADVMFPTDAYHGTNADIHAFDPLLSDTRRKTGTPNGAIVSSTNPKTASTYAGEVTDDYGNIINYKDGGNVLPLRVNTGNGLSVNAKGANWGDIFAPKYPDAETTNDIAQIALDKGKQSATIKKVLDNATWSKQNGVDSRIGDTIFSFNPDDIRSRFAAFDPWRRNAAIAASMGVAAPDLLANPLDDKNNRLIEILRNK